MRKAIIISSFLALTAFPAVSYALMAPVYPDAVPAPHEIDKNVKDYMQAFYSKDPIEKVKKYYDSKLGKMEEIKSKKYYKKILKKVDRGIYDTYEPSELGVIISTNIKKTGKDKSSLYNHDFFDYLKVLSAQLKEKSRKDYEDACERFESLIYSYFLPSGKKDQKGRAINTAEAMIAQYKKDNPGFMEKSDSAEQMAKKMQKLMQQGKMSEVVALSKQMKKNAPSAHKPDIKAWNKYIKLLETLEKKHAYKTMIIIHTGK